MPRCPWIGVICGCGKGYPWPENGLMPERCEARMDIDAVAMYPKQVRPAKLAEYQAVLEQRKRKE